MVRAVIFDWAGTAVDFGSLAPVAAFAAAFERAGIVVSTEEIRKPMGLGKRRHLEAMLGDAAVAARWREAYGRPPDDRDIEGLYASFDRALVAILPKHADPVPGLLETIAYLRAAAIAVGSNSGYSSEEMEVLSRAARERGFEPDCIVSSSDVAHGRPAPDLSRKCLELLGLGGSLDAIKVDDTPSGIEEGRNAGLRTVAVAVSGNEVGLSLDQWSRLAAGEQSLLRKRAYERLQRARSDFIIDTVADLPRVLDTMQ